MKKYGKVVVESVRGHRNWAVQVFVLSISLSLAFGFLSQTLLSSLGAVFASFPGKIFCKYGLCERKSYDKMESNLWCFAPGADVFRGEGNAPGTERDGP